MELSPRTLEIISTETSYYKNDYDNPNALSTTRVNKIFDAFSLFSTQLWRST